MVSKHVGQSLADDLEGMKVMVGVDDDRRFADEIDISRKLASQLDSEMLRVQSAHQETFEEGRKVGETSIGLDEAADQPRVGHGPIEREAGVPSHVEWAIGQAPACDRSLGVG